MDCNTFVSFHRWMWTKNESIEAEGGCGEYFMKYETIVRYNEIPNRTSTSTSTYISCSTLFIGNIVTFILILFQYEKIGEALDDLLSLTEEDKSKKSN